VIEAYSRRVHVGRGWLFLTGKHEDIQLVSKKLGLASLIDRWNRDGHQPALMVGNESTGEWMRSSAVENPKFLAGMMSDVFGWNGKPVRTYAAPVATPRAGKGEFLFNTRCASCHSIGKGDGLGPDLVNVTTLRERAWLARYVAEPDRVLAEGDGVAAALFAKYKDVRMPNLGLNDEEVAALLSHIEQQSRDAREASGSIRPVQLVGRCDLVDAEAVDGMKLEHQPLASRERGERCPEGALELAPIAQLQVIQLGIGAPCG